MHNYHLVCFKFLINAYQTQAGRRHMNDKAKSLQIIEFCTKSLLSSNQKTTLHAALCLFNHLLCYESENKRDIQVDLEQALKALDEVLSDKEMNDSEVLMAAILCECRILYQNPEMCMWVEETFKLFFKETHQELKRRVQASSVKDSIADVLSLVDLEQKKSQ